MKDFQDIERIFNREKRPFWVLFDAKGKRRSCTSDGIMKMSDPKERLTESFKFLEEVLEDEGDGVYKIQLRTSENAGKQQIENTFQYGEYVEPVTVSRGVERTERKASGGGSIGALGSIGGLEFITGLMQNGRSEADRLRDEKNELKLELMEKKFQIAGLEAQVNAPAATESGWGDIIKGVFQDHSMDILDRIFPEERTTAIATLRSRRRITVDEPTPKREKRTEKRTEKRNVIARNEATQRDAPTATAKDVPKSGKSDKSPQARFTAAFQKMEVHFPDENPIDVLEALNPIFDDVAELFPDDNPLDVLEIVLKMARSKMGKTMIVPMVQKELDKLALEKSIDDENEDVDYEDAEGDDDQDDEEEDVHGHD